MSPLPSPNAKVCIFQTISELAETVLNELVARTHSIPDETFLTVALSGGTTPKQLFEACLTSNKYKEVSWNKILFFWVDERCVPPDQEESNYGMANNHFLRRLNIPEAHIFRMHGEAVPEKEVIRYRRILSENVPTRHNLPCFDFILLGLGEDGHTASIFPGNTGLFQTVNSCEVVQHPQTGQRRITLTGSVLNNAVDVVFLVTGSLKAAIVSNILQSHTTEFPASLVHPHQGRLIWLLDKDAASSVAAYQDCSE
jgi:6-phosphogluconolactonase